jgi:hypothetical protein
MEDRTRGLDIERTVTQVLSEFGIEVDIQHWASDAVAIVVMGRGGYDATYRMAWLPHPTLSEVSRLDQYGHVDPLLVASPWINGRTADALRDAHIDYVDQAGNAHLQFGPVLIDIRGRRREHTEPIQRSPDANLFSARRMQVIFALLTWPDIVNMPVRAIARAAGTSVGITQSTIDIMRDTDYLIGKSLQSRDELIDLWTAAFRGSLLPKIRNSSFSGNIERWSPPPGYFVSGESAVRNIRQHQTLTIYVDAFDPMEAVKNGWRKSDDPNINIRDKFWSEPHEASKRFQLAEFFARERSRTHPDRVRARNAITALTIAVFPTR